jgi:FkbM family methyltransferase
VYAVPGARPATRHLVRYALQRSNLPHAARQRLYNFFASEVSPEEPVVCDVGTDPGQLRLELNLQDDLSRNWYFWGYAGFEPGLTRLWRRLVASRQCVFDIGANVGYYALYAANLLNEHGTVHAFEPSPHVFERLWRNAQLNQLADLRLNQVALADTDGSGYLFIPAADGDTNASIVPGFNIADDCISVPLMRFDSYCEAHNIQRVDLVKIDVEGAELSVLRGMGDLLREWQPDIIVEVLQPYDDVLDHFFRGTAYRKFLITNQGLCEMDRIRANSMYRDVYLSVAPVCA